MELSQLTEQELAEEIARLHATGLGFRRISKKLGEKGIKSGKDRCNRIFRKYRALMEAGLNDPNGIMDEDLGMLVEEEKQAQKRVELARSIDRGGISSKRNHKKPLSPKTHTIQSLLIVSPIL